MSATIEALQAALDQKPDDWQTRQVLADALDEAAGGECPLGHAQRWMAEHRRIPNLDGTWDWWCFKATCKFDQLRELHEHHHVDEATFQALAAAGKASTWDGDCAYKEYAGRREAEEALANALWARRPAE